MIGEGMNLMNDNKIGEGKWKDGLITTVRIR